MSKATTHIEHLISHTGVWKDKEDFYSALNKYAQQVDQLDHELLTNEMDKVSILKAVYETFAPKEN